MSHANLLTQTHDLTGREVSLGSFLYQEKSKGRQ
jgi:hypothetical protein